MSIAIPLYQVDAFAERLFTGNPAAVCPLDTWLPDDLLLAIAAENNLSETAFFVPRDDRFELRWFTPATEVDLCGHATLAAGCILLSELQPHRGHVDFDTRSGRLRVERDHDTWRLDLPALPVGPAITPTREMAAALPGVDIVAWHAGHHHLVVVNDAATVQSLAPDFAVIASLGRDGFIVTARGHDVDFVSRFFAPHQGIPEDPVTGSAHCTLLPYWSQQLGRSTLIAKQLSTRGGLVHGQLDGTRVALRGRCVVYLRGTIDLPAAP